MPDSTARTNRGGASPKGAAAGPPRKTTAQPRNTPGQPPNTPGQPRSAPGQPRTAAGRPPSPGGQPLKTKAEKRAEAKVAKARARARQKRRQMLTVGGSAAIVLVLLVGLIAWIGHTSPSSPAGAAGNGASAGSTPAATSTGTGSSPAATSTDTGSSPAATPSAAFPPVPAGADPALRKKPAVAAGTGAVTKLKVTPLIQGKGPAAESGQTITVNYVGATYADGKQFDSSWSRSQPFSFPLGAGNVIKGWDQGLLGVKVGSRVQLDIPADLAYGDNPGGGRPGGALRFVVDVLAAS